MPLRTGYGSAGREREPRVEVARADELPQPITAGDGVAVVQATAQAEGRPKVVAAAGERRPNGTLAKGGRTVQSAGNRAMRESQAAREELKRLGEMLGLSKFVADTSFGPYREQALQFLRAHTAELQRQAGGEVLGPGPASMVASAALQMAASRWAFDRGAEQADAAMMKLGSQLANDSRQNLLAAYELAIREAQARPRAAVDPMARIRALAQGGKP